MQQRDRTFPRRVASNPAARWLVALAAVAGLFAMHGLAEHGAMQHEGAPMVGMQQAHDAATELLTDGAIVLTDVTAIGTRDATASPTADDPGRDAGVAMALCLAIVAGLVIALTHRGGARPEFLVDAWRHTRRVLVASRARVADPPDLFALSILRC